MAVASALKVARDLPEDAIMVILLPDGGRGYLGKVFNDSGWQATASPQTARAAPSPTCWPKRRRPQTAVRARAGR